MLQCHGRDLASDLEPTINRPELGLGPNVKGTISTGKMRSAPSTCPRIYHSRNYTYLMVLVTVAHTCCTFLRRFSTDCHLTLKSAHAANTIVDNQVTVYHHITIPSVKHLLSPYRRSSSSMKLPSQREACGPACLDELAITHRCPYHLPELQA